MESEERNISVWVCREEKLVLGVSKRTTCADVIQVLVEEQSAQHGLPVSQSYCIVEKWRGFERILPHRTKIYRLWLAWAEEQSNVKFVLVRSEASLEQRGARSAEARVVLSKQNPGVPTESTRAPVPPEKHRRVVRRAFRKLERINKRKARAAHRDASCAERMETLIHLVVSQDHTIRQQVQRITEVDAEIEVFESKVHSDRIRKHGANYVLNTYLVDGDALDSAQNFEVLVRRCEEVLRLQEDLLEQEGLIESLRGQIQEELKLRGMESRAAQGSPCPDTKLLLETERIQTQLDASLYISLRLNADLEAIRSDLELSQQISEAREKEMRDLVEKVNMMVVMDTLVPTEAARGLSEPLCAHDDDSDTGLSSLHSQDSDLPVWESRV